MPEMHKPIPFEIQGIAPVILHNGQLADPLNEYSKRIKEITSKKTKTDNDYKLLYDLEWEGSLYVREGKIAIPGDNIEAAMIEGGKKLRLGPACKAGIMCLGDPLLIYEGSKDLDKLKGLEKYRDIRGVRIKGSRVQRCRPIFRPWGLKFEILYLPDLLNEKQVRDILDIVGRIIGLCDFKPKYGRFEVV